MGATCHVAGKPSMKHDGPGQVTRGRGRSARNGLRGHAPGAELAAGGLHHQHAVDHDLAGADAATGAATTGAALIASPPARWRAAKLPSDRFSQCR